MVQTRYQEIATTKSENMPKVAYVCHFGGFQLIWIACKSHDFEAKLLKNRVQIEVNIQLDFGSDFGAILGDFGRTWILKVFGKDLGEFWWF